MIRPEINLHYEIDGFTLHKSTRVCDWLASVILSEKKEVAVLNYIFCSDEYLLEINRKYLNHDYYTDIISFPMKSDPIEGDIFISIERVRENAEGFGEEFNTELNRVMVHGLLHFLGYNDHTEIEKQQMRSKENEYLELA